MNMSQHDFALIKMRDNGIMELVEPLLKYDSTGSLKAAATIAYLVGADQEGDGLEMLKNATSSIDRFVDLFNNTLNVMKNDGYQYGVYPLSSCVRAMAILALTTTRTRVTC